MTQADAQTPDAAFDRLAAIVGEDMFEPRCAYHARGVFGGLAHFAADAEAFVPAEKTSIDGAGNFLFTGLNTQIDRVGEISIRGSGNIVFMGADCRFPALRVIITGDDNLIYLGAFANGGQMHIDIVGDGRLVRVGEDAMLARSRLSIGLGREIEVIGADGQTLSPVSGRPLTEDGDIVVDGRVWVGRDALIAEGVRIASSAIVGSRSLVASDVAGSTVNTGAPARRLGQNVTFSRSKASSLAADQALSRHGDRLRRRAVLNGLFAQAVEADDGLSLNDRMSAFKPAVSSADASAPAAAKGPGAPPKRSATDLAEAHARLRALAGDLPLDIDPSAVVVAGAGGFSHVSAASTGLRGYRPAGTGNYLFTAPGCDLSGLRIEFTGADNTTIYIGPGVKAVEASILRVVGASGGFIYIGAKSILREVTATLSGPEARLVIGADCILDGGVTLSSADGYALFDQASGETINPTCRVSIGEHVYIGLGAVITKGADIGSGSVVAPRSVVAGPVPADSFHVGFPATTQPGKIRWNWLGAGRPR